MPPALNPKVILETHAQRQIEDICSTTTIPPSPQCSVNAGNVTIPRLKSPLKFPRNSKKNPLVNKFPTVPQSRWDTWQEMVKLYETQDSPHLEYLKKTLPKFKRTRPKVTYEDPIGPQVNTYDVRVTPSSNHRPSNDDLIEAVTAHYTPSSQGPPLGLNTHRISMSSVTIGTERTEEMGKISDNIPFYLPDTVECHHKPRTNFCHTPHLRVKLHNGNGRTSTVSYMLSDTGASNSIVSVKWLRQFCPEAIIKYRTADFQGVGDCRQNAALGTTTLSFKVVGKDDQEMIIEDDFWIISETGPVQLILGQTVLANEEIYKGQNAKEIIFFDQSSNKTVVVPYIYMATAQQHTTVSGYSAQLGTCPLLPESLPISPVRRQTIPAHSKSIVACHLPDLAGCAATPTHGQDVIITPDLLDKEQREYSVSVSEAVSTLHTLAESDTERASLLTFVENPTNEEIFLETNHVLGHASIIPSPSEGEMSLQEWKKSQELLAHFSDDDLLWLRSRMPAEDKVNTFQDKSRTSQFGRFSPPVPGHTRPTAVPADSHGTWEAKTKKYHKECEERGKAAQVSAAHKAAREKMGIFHPTARPSVNSSELSSPIVIPLADNYELRNPRYEERFNWRTPPEGNVTDNLSVTELRPDMVDIDGQVVGEAYKEVSEEEFLEQFDLDHLPEVV